MDSVSGGRSYALIQRLPSVRTDVTVMTLGNWLTVVEHLSELARAIECEKN